MAVGFPTKTTYANGDVFSASDINDTNGTLNLIATQPAFRVYRATSDVSLTSGVYTKVPFNAETFDTNSNFDSTTNYRFTPTVAGYYQLNSTLLGVGTAGAWVLAIYFNGVVSNLKDYPMPSQGYGSQSIEDIYYFNGSSDYAEIYTLIGGSGAKIANGSAAVNFSGAMIRRA
jgi:hypothetical protein